MERCNHTSVGILIERDDKILLIERKNFPFGYAPPAGHVKDGESYEDAAHRELKEETGLIATDLELLTEGRKEFGCRHGSTWHYWKLFKANVEGKLAASPDEAKQAGWFSRKDVKDLQLDPVIGVWFKELGII